MKNVWCGVAAAALCLAPAGRADEAPRAGPKTFQVPYRLTVPKHILVRAKINGKGPYNFILDTGAPALFVATDLCRKLGVKPDKNSWGVFDRFEIEGGVVLTKFKGRVETPFQLEGMNGMGLAGAELHGIIGYNVLARYRMEIDFTRDKMAWTELDFEPRPPLGLGAKVGGAGGMEILGSVMKMMGSLLGKKAGTESVPRGFLGIELKGGEDDEPVVAAVLGDGPAGRAGVKAGDRITRVQGRTVVANDDVRRLSGNLRAGAAVKLTVKRDGETKEFSFQTGEGF
jgi:hypothetical protein